MLAAPPPSDGIRQDQLNPAVLHDETTFATKRLAAFQYIVAIVMIFLVSGFWTLQVQNTEIYTEAADRNRIKSTPISASRGKILDRDGRVIVENVDSFTVFISKENLRMDHLPDIARGLNLNYEELLARLEKYRTAPKYYAIAIKEKLTPGDVAFVESHRDPDTFPELELVHGQHRLYPQDNLLAHVIGYVGEVTERELDSPDYARYNQGDVIGKQGIERYYNDQLMGTDGQRQVVVDKLGNERQLIGYKDPIAGRSIQLTIDLDLQAVAEMALGTRRGAVVALDPRTGEVLAMASRPAFDPNKFAGRILKKDWDEINNNPDKPMFNRAIQSNLSPGSTFKPLMALAGLEAGVVDAYTTVNCAGGANYFGNYFKCSARSGHGAISLNRAIAKSCNVYFYYVGNKLGIDRIAAIGDLAGLGKPTGIDLPFENRGLLPSAKWKSQVMRQRWFAGETISTVIGQGDLTVTPLQLAHMTGGIAVGGIWHKPHLKTDPAKAAETVRGNFNMDNVGQVIYGMYNVVNGGGTAPQARIPGFEVCGKTGTAQLASNKFLKGTAAGRAMKDNAWFVGFAPRTNPEIVVAALFEGGEHGYNAAPIVRNVMKAYFDKRSRRVVPAPTLAMAPLGANGFGERATATEKSGGKLVFDSEPLVVEDQPAAKERKMAQ